MFNFLGIAPNLILVPGFIITPKEKHIIVNKEKGTIEFTKILTRLRVIPQIPVIILARFMLF